MQAIITPSKMRGRLRSCENPYTTAILERDLEAIQDYNTTIDELVVANGISATPPDFYRISRPIRTSWPMVPIPTVWGTREWRTDGSMHCLDNQCN
jgi:hypothetical protein